MFNVKKKSGEIVNWNVDKIKIAVTKSADRVNIHLTQLDFNKITEYVLDHLTPVNGLVSVENIHGAVEGGLRVVNRAVADSYANYRNYRKDTVEMLEDIYKKTKDVLWLGDRENANYNSALISTKGSLVRGYLTGELYKKYFMSKEELAAIKDGWIYAHDMRDLIFGHFNCCLFNIENVLSGGFEMSGIKYKEPKSILSALQVIGDVTLVATAQQFGGFTLPELDRVLVKYARKTIEKYTKEAEEFGIPDVQKYVDAKLDEEIKQGLQSLEMKLNTVPCSRGDTAFVTVSFGNCDVPEDADLQRRIASWILKTRMHGQGNGSPVVFPKLIYLHSLEQHKDPEQEKLFDLAIQCSSKVMYPDYLSLDAGYVGEIYKSTGKVISAMGCRAYLSDWKDENGESQFTGRANIGAVSLNLPMIWQKSKGKDFYKDLDYYLELTRSFLKKRYDAVANNLCSTNPLAFTQGGIIGGTKKPTDKIGMDIVKSFTASFGITSLNELNMLMEGKPLHESDQKLVISVVQYIQDKVDMFKEEDGYLYALYGTPAESLAGTQLKQFKKMFGVVPGVSDRDYFTNSFHCHVSADIDPFTKQSLEYDLFHMINGGHIQYGRMGNPKNTVAVKAFVRRGMEMGFYLGTNHPVRTCEDCGHHPDSPVVECPECGSNNITVIDRVCGYLGISEASGGGRFNDGKLAELKDRISM